MAQQLTDNCPQWADELLKKLLDMEQSLGNIPASEEWKSNFVAEIHHKITTNKGYAFSDEETEILFAKIVKGLHQENFSAEQIHQFINSRVGYKNGPPYCTLNEVQCHI